MLSIRRAELQGINLIVFQEGGKLARILGANFFFQSGIKVFFF